MALPKVIRDPRVLAKVHEGPQPDEAHLFADFDRHPVHIGIAEDIPEVQKHWMVFEQLVRLAEHVALRDGAIRKRARWEYVDEVAMKLFWLLVHSDLYRPVSSAEAKRFMAAWRKADLAEARARARPAQRPARGRAPNVVDIATGRPPRRPGR